VSTEFISIKCALADQKAATNNSRLLVRTKVCNGKREHQKEQMQNKTKRNEETLWNETGHQKKYKKVEV